MAEAKKKKTDNTKTKETAKAAETAKPEETENIEVSTEEVKAVCEEPVQEGTNIKVDSVEEVSADDKEACESAKPKPVPKGSRRGSKALMLELEKTRELAQGNEEKYKRLLAEFENARQRTEKESKKMYDIGAKEVLEKLLSVVDNLERAIASIPDEDKTRPFEEGVDKIYRQMMAILDGIGVKPMNAEGTQFDPELHNAVIHVEDESLGENVVAEEMQKGYMYKDQVLRHSMVKVAN